MIYMPNQDKKESSKEETLFEKIYRFAKEKNKEALIKIVEENGCIDILQRGYTPIMRLAKEGNVASVEFLLNTFNASRNDAALGYAWGGYIEHVNQQIKQGANRNSAVFGYAIGGDVERTNQLIKQGAGRNSAVLGYACGGHIEQVDQLIERGASCNDAVLGYAYGGYVEQVNQLIEQRASLDFAASGYAEGGYVEQVDQLIEQGASRNDAVYGYAMGGHVEQVNQQIALGASRDSAVNGYAISGHVEQVNQQIELGASRDDAVNGYAEGGHGEQVNQQIKLGANRNSAVKGYMHGGYMKPANVLRLMAFTEDEELRKLLAERAKKNDDSLDIDVLQAKATRLNNIMREYQLGFNQAQSLTIQGTRAWLLQGPWLVKNGVFTPEIYYYITSFIIGPSIQDTNKVLEAVSKKLFSDSVINISSRFVLGFFSEEKYFKKYSRAEERYEKRLRF